MKFLLIDRANGSVRNDVLSGLTVALALVPEAVAFAFVAGVSPIVGLFWCFFHGSYHRCVWGSSWHDLWCNWSYGRSYGSSDPRGVNMLVVQVLD